MCGQDGHVSGQRVGQSPFSSGDIDVRAQTKEWLSNIIRRLIITNNINRLSNICVWENGEGSQSPQ